MWRQLHFLRHGWNRCCRWIQSSGRWNAKFAAGRWSDFQVFGYPAGSLRLSSLCSSSAKCGCLCWKRKRQTRTWRIVFGRFAISSIGAADRQSFSGSNNWSWMSIRQTVPLQSMLLQFQLSRQWHSPFQIGPKPGNKRSYRRQFQLSPTGRQQQSSGNGQNSFLRSQYVRKPDENNDGSFSSAETGPNQHTVIFAQQSDDVDRITGRSHPSEDRSRWCHDDAPIFYWRI